ncbi:MAG: SPOR domain-containing protein [Bacteroidia bacterium]|nr:SPOR domain-containing protein [Bacteroidia bacterium]
MERNTLLAYLQAAFRELSAFSMPGIGFFSKSYQNARLDTQQNVLLPPGETYQFSPENRGDDFLQRLLEQRLNLSPAQAAMLVADIVRMIQMELSQTGSFEVPKVGILRRNAQGIVFEAVGSTPGLEPINMEANNNHTKEATENTNDSSEELTFPETNPQATRKLMWWMAGIAAALMLGILTFSFYKTSTSSQTDATQEEALASEVVPNDELADNTDANTQPSWNSDDNTLGDENTDSSVPQDQLKTDSAMPESPKIDASSAGTQNTNLAAAKTTTPPANKSNKTQPKATHPKSNSSSKSTKANKSSESTKTSAKKEANKNSKTSKKTTQKEPTAQKDSHSKKSKTTPSGTKDKKTSADKIRPASIVAHNETNAASSKYFVIANSFNNREDAEKSVRSWKSKGEDAELIWMKKDGKFGVSLGTYSQDEDAKAAIKQKSLGASAKVYSVK